MVINGRTTNAFAGCGYAGGLPLENKWRDNLRREWLITPAEGASIDSLADNGKTVSHSDLENSKKAMDDTPLTFRSIYAYAVKHNLSVVMRFPHSSQSPPNITRDGLDTFIQALRDVRLDSKRSGNVMVIANHNWIREEPEAKRVSWHVVRRLRQSVLQNKDSCLSFADWCFAAQSLTQEQLSEMYRSDLWERDRWNDMENVLENQVLFANITGNPSLLPKAMSDDGLPLALLPKAVQEWTISKFPKARRLRLKQAVLPPFPPSTTPVRICQITLLSSDNISLFDKVYYFSPYPRSIDLSTVPSPPIQ